MKNSTHYFHVKAKILPYFQICISVPLKRVKNTQSKIKPIKTGKKLE